MNAPVEVAVAGQYRGGVQVAIDDFLLNFRVECAAHAVTGSAGIGDDSEAELLHFREQTGFLEVELRYLRARRERGLDPGLARKTKCVGLLRNQSGGDDVARVAGIGATGDRSDDDRTVRHFARIVFPLTGNAARGEVRGRQTTVRVGRAGHVALDLAQVELEHALVLGVLQVISPEAGSAGIVFDQRHLFGLAAGQLEVVDGLLVDIKHCRRGAVLRRHVRNCRAVADGQARGTVAEKLEPGGNHACLAQEFGQREHDIGGGDTGLALTVKPNADDIGQTHHRRSTEHDGFGLEAADTDRDHTEAIDVRRVTIGTDTGVGEGNAFARLYHR